MLRRLAFLIAVLAVAIGLGAVPSFAQPPSPTPAAGANGAAGLAPIISHGAAPGAPAARAAGPSCGRGPACGDPRRGVDAAAVVGKDANTGAGTGGVDTGLAFATGDSLYISADLNTRGAYGPEGDGKCGPAGTTPFTGANGARYQGTAACDAGKPTDSNGLVPNAPVGALIGRIGNNSWFQIGGIQGFPLQQGAFLGFAISGAGDLYLAYNDEAGDYPNNAGGYAVSVIAATAPRVYAGVSPAGDPTDATVRTLGRNQQAIFVGVLPGGPYTSHHPPYLGSYGSEGESGCTDPHATTDAAGTRYTGSTQTPDTTSPLAKNSYLGGTACATKKAAGAGAPLPGGQGGSVGQLVYQLAGGSGWHATDSNAGAMVTAPATTPDAGAALELAYNDDNVSDNDGFYSVILNVFAAPTATPPQPPGSQSCARPSLQVTDNDHSVPTIGDVVGISGSGADGCQYDFQIFYPHGSNPPSTQPDLDSGWQSGGTYNWVTDEHYSLNASSPNDPYIIQVRAQHGAGDTPTVTDPLSYQLALCLPPVLALQTSDGGPLTSAGLGQQVKLVDATGVDLCNDEFEVFYPGIAAPASLSSGWVSEVDQTGHPQIYAWDTAAHNNGPSTAGSPYELVLLRWLPGTNGATAVSSGLVPLQLTACNVTLAASPQSAQDAGKPVKLTASVAASGFCKQPKFRFQVAPKDHPDNRTPIGPTTFGSGTQSWDTSNVKPGSYRLYAQAGLPSAAHAPQNGAAPDAAVDEAAATTYAVAGETGIDFTVVAACTTPGLRADTTSPQAGQPDALQATETGCPDAVYKFYYYAPKSNTPVPITPAGVNGGWQDDSRAVFQPAVTVQPGTYTLFVAVKHRGWPDASSVPSKAVAVTVNSAPCTAPTLTVSANRVNPGQAVTLTGQNTIDTAQATGCSDAVFKFYVKDSPDANSATVLQDWSAKSSAQWKTAANLKTGNYSVYVAVRHSSLKGPWTDFLPSGPQTVTVAVGPSDLVIVSLGDSYASGEGNPVRDQNGNLVWDQDDTCHRSSKAAPWLASRAVQAALPQTAVHSYSFACSGATVDGGLLGPQTAGGSSQLDQVVQQLQADGIQRIDLLTLSIGGNDIGFADVVLHCLVLPKVFYSCDQDQGLNKEVNDGMSTLPDKFKRINQALKDLAGGGLAVKNVLLTQYPTATRDARNATCAGNHPSGFPDSLSDGEYKFADGATTRLNDSLKSAVAAANAANRTGGPAWSLVSEHIARFEGHGLCGPSASWFLSLNDGLAINDANGTMHPNAAGQSAIARALLDSELPVAKKLLPAAAGSASTGPEGADGAPSTSIDAVLPADTP